MKKALSDPKPRRGKSGLNNLILIQFDFFSVLQRHCRSWGSRYSSNLSAAYGKILSEMLAYLNFNPPFFISEFTDIIPLN